MSYSGIVGGRSREGVFPPQVMESGVSPPENVYISSSELCILCHSTMLHLLDVKSFIVVMTFNYG